MRYPQQCLYQYLRVFTNADLRSWKHSLKATIMGVGTAVPPTSYSQQELLDFGAQDRRTRSIFLNGAIERRYLTLPPVNGSCMLRIESQGELLDKHRDAVSELARKFYWPAWSRSMPAPQTFRSFVA